MRRGGAVLAILIATLALTGCEQTFRNMYDQPRYKPLAASGVWPDGRASRPPVEGTVARSAGTFAGTTSGRLGDALSDEATGDASGAMTTRPPVTLALVQRGRERFEIFCAPCHSVLGDGDGMIVRRGFPAPPSYHCDRLRNADDRHFYDVITHGYGGMYPYATRVAPRDRWAIVAYIRALQLSQQAPLSSVPDDDTRQRLQEAR